MNNLMFSARLLATEPLFRTACAIDLKAALAQWGLVLNKTEFKAFSRAWALLISRMEDVNLPPISLPDIDSWT